MSQKSPINGTTNGSFNGHSGPISLDAFDMELRRILRSKPHFESDIPWSRIAKGFATKLDDILENCYHSDLDSRIQNMYGEGQGETIHEFKDRLIKDFTQKFTQSPPFTILRLAEILLEPKTYYSSPEKLLRALESIISVISSPKDFGVRESIKDQRLSHETKTEKIVPVTIGDEAQTILLSKIDWLTDQDIKEIESESYVADLTAPLEEVIDMEHKNTEEESSNDNSEESRESEDEIKKRKASENDNVDTNSTLESPEKKAKMETQESNVEDKTEAKDPIATDPDQTLPEDKMDESLIIDTDKQDKSVLMEDVNTTLPELEPDTEDNETEIANETDDPGDDTLPEDRMDVDCSF
ncbi:CYFA0S01e19746g1_1 [Cyberlindnera fabianii]|uniref:CYFA0S01e19746g1_1 n=1 Tax=Cyberlindnera fabianii TaxID=36022 RepID=A0A061ALI7_CYBFA|nr:CYFA0S01e19746g1_1 [Cyberlindnera fabianii]